MKKLDSKKKKILISAVALVLVAAIGVGIWFGARGSAEPVNVYPFNYIGMTEYWGDNQESYGPVSTDKIQTVYLSDTQTVTEVLVAEGDEVKKGDVLMTFDTTLTELELERKRLDVEKQKLDLKDAQAQLQKIRNMKPMDPNAGNSSDLDMEEPDLGDILTGSYEISQDEEYDGSSVEKALICWVKDGIHINDPMLRAIRLQALAYQQENANRPNSSASDTPDDEIVLLQDEEDDGDNEEDIGDDDKEDIGDDDKEDIDDDDKEDNGDGDDNEGGQPVETVSQMIDISYVCYEDTALSDGFEATYSEIVVGNSDVVLNAGNLRSTITVGDTTYRFRFLKCIGDDSWFSELTIPAYPQDDEAAQIQWQNTWGNGIVAGYVRELHVSDITIECDEVAKNGTLEVEAGKNTALHFSAYMDSAPSGGRWRWSVSPQSGEGGLSATSNGNFLTLSGEPGEEGEAIPYTVTASYIYTDTDGSERTATATFSFTLAVEENHDPGVAVDDYYVIIKVTQDNLSRADRLVWQGMHVFCYEGGGFGFTFFDANILADHTLTELDEEDTGSSGIDFGSGYTASEIAKMRAEQELKVKEQELALKMAEAEFNIMQAEVNDGKVCADFDGKVVSVLNEEEARQDKRPLLKVSAGGGFYVEVSVNELEMEKLKIGQEVTVNDWNTGMTYTGTVESIGDFPVSASSWSSSDNANVTYYPFTVFVDSSADLQAGNYVNVTYSTSESENGVYLENAFIRTEQGRSYIFVEGEDGKLEKRYVTVGKSLWGSWTQVLSGLTEDDYLAFPYGKTVKEGAPAVESENLSSLYSY